MKKNPVVHFQMPYEDGNRMSQFYAKAFGWEAKETGPDMGGYITVTTTETGENGRPTTPGSINGGFFKKMEDRNSQIPNVVIAVEDIGTSLKDVEAAGGKVNSQPVEIPGVGLFAMIFDTEGNQVCLLQPKGM